MHELSIAMGIVEVAEEESAGRGGAAIRAIHLKLGALSGVVKEALLFSWDVASEGTSIAGARLVIEDVPIRVYCPVCRGPQKVESMQHFVCPQCRRPVSEVLEGRELQVFALEMRE